MKINLDVEIFEDEFLCNKEGDSVFSNSCQFLQYGSEIYATCHLFHKNLKSETVLPEPDENGFRTSIHGMGSFADDVNIHKCDKCKAIMNGEEYIDPPEESPVAFIMFKGKCMSPEEFDAELEDK